MDKTRTIVELFERIDAIPRKSKNEQKIVAWLEEWAGKHSFRVKKDAVPNIAIYVPASQGYESAPTVVLQAHTDMVCEKTPDSTHDFSKDPIRFVYDGDWLKADRTTLGADNGLGVALAMQLAVDEEVRHPALELFFTADEETGLGGANRFDPSLLTGKILINLDSENDSEFTIGCAGGKETDLTVKPAWETVQDVQQAYHIAVGGLHGGHSGQDIDKIRGNANILLGRTLHEIRKKFALKLIEISGGSAHNAIPRDSRAQCICACRNLSEVQSIVAECEKAFKNEFGPCEPSLSLTCESIALKPGAKKAIDEQSTRQIIRLLLALPHGVAKKSSTVDNFVETSNNFASIRMDGETVAIKTSQRSALASGIDWITSRVESVGYLTGAEVRSGNGYPGWQPDMNAALLKRCTAIYTTLFNSRPEIRSVHAGLECGIIGAKIPGMEMISIGPTIQYPHSPNECAYIPSIRKVWEFLKAVLESCNE